MESRPAGSLPFLLLKPASSVNVQVCWPLAGGEDVAGACGSEPFVPSNVPTITLPEYELLVPKLYREVCRSHKKESDWDEARRLLSELEIKYFRATGCLLH
jgi:hypothetical protein